MSMQFRGRIFGAVMVASAAIVAGWTSVGAEPGLFRSTVWTRVELDQVVLPEDIPPIPRLEALPADVGGQCRRLRESGVRLPFVTYPDAGVPVLASTAYVAFTETHFVALLEGVQGGDYELQAHPQELEDGHIWNDDNFEVFVDPFLTRSEYAHFIVNPLGEVFDQWCLEKRVPDPKATDPGAMMVVLDRDVSYRSGASVPVERIEGHWSAVFRLPFSCFALDAPPVGQVWGFNFCHTNRENGELSQWRSTPGRKGFHQPRLFGPLRFGRDTGGIRAAFRLPVAGVGKNVLQVEVRGGEVGARAMCRIMVKDREQTPVSDRSVTFTLREGVTRRDIAFDIPSGIRGTHRFSAEIRVSGEVAGYYVRNVTLRPPVEVSLPLTQIYTTDRVIEGTVRLNLGAESLATTPVRFALTGEGISRRHRVERMPGNNLRFALDGGRLRPGRYTFSVIAEGVPGGECEFDVIPAPFDF